MRHLVLVGLVWLLVLPAVLSVEDDISQANRFLSAEVQRQIRDAKDEMTADLKEYQDENFVLLDQRMHSLMDDTRMKVVLGAIGAALVANALTAIVLVKTMRSYSYERYLEQLAKSSEQGVVGDSVDMEAQQREWYPQQPQETIAMQIGQSQAANSTMMNTWQAQPAYAGSWRAPVDTQQGYQNVPTEFQYNYPQQGGGV